MATNSVVITVEGVLQKNVSYAPIVQGKALYIGLSNVYNLLLVTDSNDEKLLERWLDLENLNKHGMIVYNDAVLAAKSPGERRLAQVNILRSRGYAIDFVIDPAPDVSAKLLGAGISVLNFLHSSYSLPEWRPDFKESIKPWEEIVETNERLAYLKAQDIKEREKKNADE